LVRFDTGSQSAHADRGGAVIATIATSVAVLLSLGEHLARIREQQKAGRGSEQPTGVP